MGNHRRGRHISATETYLFQIYHSPILIYHSPIMLSTAVLFALVGLSLQAAAPKPPAPKPEAWVKPAFCRGNDCPRYVVLEKKADYEVRKYEAAQWVSTRAMGMEYRETTSGLFMKLFGYIEGENEGSQKVKMTSPVTTLVKPGTGPNCKSTFTRSFYIPYSQQLSAPKPSATDVFLEQRPELTVFVRSFSGYATADDHIKNIQTMAKAINNQDLYETDYYYTAGYDGPYIWFDRHNEVWLVAKN